MPACKISLYTLPPTCRYRKTLADISPNPRLAIHDVYFFPIGPCQSKIVILSASNCRLHSSVTGVIMDFSGMHANCTDFCLVFNDDTVFSYSTFVCAGFSSCCVVWANTQQQLQQPPPPPPSPPTTTTTTTTKQQHKLQMGLETLFIVIATLYSSQFNSNLSTSSFQLTALHDPPSKSALISAILSFPRFISCQHQLQTSLYLRKSLFSHYLT